MFPAPLQKLLDLIFPPVCLSCGSNLTRAFPLICERCFAGLGVRGEFVCSSCGKRMADGRCHAGSIAVFASFSYESEPARQIIHALKYAGTEAAARTVAHLMMPLFLEAIPKTEGIKIFLVPIPLHKQRERERGFNQSLLVANFLSGGLKKHGLQASVRTNLIKRERKTESQTACKTKKERKENVRGCFSVGNALNQKNALVFLVDDVVTSGATIEEAALTLRKAGVPHVAGLAIAKT